MQFFKANVLVDMMVLRLLESGGMSSPPASPRAKLLAEEGTSAAAAEGATSNAGAAGAVTAAGILAAPGTAVDAGAMPPQSSVNWP